MRISRQRDSVFFAETPQGPTYFPFGRFSGGVVISLGREDEFYTFQHRWSVRARIASAVGVLVFIGAPGFLKAAGIVLVIGLIAAKKLAVRRLTDALPQSYTAAPHLTLAERLRAASAGPLFASLVFFLVLLAVTAQEIYGHITSGQPFSVHDAKVLGPVLFMSLLLAGLLILRRFG